MVPFVQLTGDAIGGIAPHLDHLKEMVAAGTPVQVKLGRNPGRKRLNQLRLENYFADLASVPTPKPVVDWSTKAGASLSRVFLNDTYGDCVIAGKAHGLGVATAADSDSGGIVLPTDQEVYSQYQAICGPGDNGCIITDVLDVMASKGFLAGGKYYKIDGYVSMDWTNKLLVQIVIDILGVPTIGFSIPSAWMNSSIWDVTNSPIVGGHDVTPLGYNDQGVQVASWGRIYTITWAAFLSTRYLDEMYAVLYQNWYNADKLAPSGIDAATLKADLAKITGGVVPDNNPPVPPVPPVPPTPPPVANPVAMVAPVTGHLFGLIPVSVPGQVAPVVDGSAHFRAPKTLSIWNIFQHAMAIFAALESDAALIAAVNALLADFGIPPVLLPHATMVRTAVKKLGASFWTIFKDALAIAAAIATGNPVAIEQAVVQLLTDLGIHL